MLLLYKLLAPREDRDERGATAVEYGLMVAMIAIVIVGGVSFFGKSIVNLYSIPSGVFKP
ncbi:Flp/Fap pilin component [Nocardioides exalbidus]|uniref:Flp/Fap pilin component n=1 Tax=Nocardioides exalbidus TaxID=402596 RepID=A0A1H4ZYN4_9ACTN|nr:Flp family type IVb pilin [Nocardioides exalbidus]SED35192.1 Flp/Fap pilin component [Nocardioides exalbidus]